MDVTSITKYNKNINTWKNTHNQGEGEILL